MKKGILLLVLILSVVFITGCNEVENPQVRGIKQLNSTDTEEIIYEWDYYEPEKMISIIKVYTYGSSTNSMYNIKAIDCETFKRQGSLFDCKVEKKDGKVIYKEYYFKDEIKTEEEAKEEILKQGYKIN